ncbi:serine/threonine protein kinase, partial [Streptomyces sp. SID8111]|nr:serine/threonine protein kinase [Streptomyces sp. SID8111]
MKTRTPAEPARGTPAPPGPRPRGRHRKPRRRKVLLVAGGLALAAGTLGLVRLVSGPGGADTGAVAGPRPVPDG